MPTFEKNRFLGLAFVILGLLKIFNILIVSTGIEYLFQADQKIIFQKPVIYLTVYNLLLGITLIIGGYGFLNTKQWTKILGLLASVLALFDYPLGTLFGICGIWFLTSNECKEFYEEPELEKRLELTIMKI